MEKRWERVWPLWVPKVYEIHGPVGQYIRWWAEYRPEHVALNFYGRVFAYRELEELIQRTAGALVKVFGVRKGDRVAIFMQNSPQFIVVFFAAHRAGAIAVPLNPMLKALELEYELKDCGAKILFTHPYLAQEVFKVAAKTPLKAIVVSGFDDFLPKELCLPLPLEVEEDRNARIGSEAVRLMDVLMKAEGLSEDRVGDIRSELATIQYTGGTTGLPKGAMITHYALSLATVAAVHWYRFRESDVFLGVTPFFHIMGQVQLMCQPLVCGGAIIVLSRFDPDTVCKAIELFKCTYWVAPTTAIVSILNYEGARKYDLSSIRCLWTGGSAVTPDIQSQMRHLFPKAIIGEGYGLTETVCQGGAITPLHLYKPGFVGIPQVNDLRIVDPDTGQKELEPYEEGEIAIKGPILMGGYWNKPKETEETFKDGWFLTGDIGLMDEDGFVKISGRKKEMIKCSGYSVFPMEVEELLYKHPAVKEAAVIGVPDPYRGESPKAFVVLKPEFKGRITERDLLEWCKENMAAYKRPREIEFREDLPKSAAGKVLRRVLMEEERKKKLATNKEGTSWIE